MKKILAIMLILVFLLTLTSCNKKTQREKDTTISQNPFDNSDLSNKQKEPKLTKTKALEIASDLIAHYETYENTGVMCNLSNSTDSLEERTEILSMLPEETRDACETAPHKSLCCQTYEDVKNHIYEFIDDSLVTHINDRYVFYNNNLYFFMGAQGDVSYEDLELTDFNEQKITATANLYISGDLFYETYSFTIKKSDNGKYKISKIEKAANAWTTLYKDLLLNFPNSQYAEYYTDQTVPVLFDINNDKTPELFVFCAIGARGYNKNGIMFQIKNNKVEAYFCDDFGFGSGSYNNIKLYKDSNGKQFVMLSVFEITEKSGFESFGNTLTKVTFDGQKITTKQIAHNEGTVKAGMQGDTYTLNGLEFNDFESYYNATAKYLSSLTEIKTKTSLKTMKASTFPIGLYGIDSDFICRFFTAYLRS